MVENTPKCFAASDPANNTDITPSDHRKIHSPGGGSNGNNESLLNDEPEFPFPEATDERRDPCEPHEETRKPDDAVESKDDTRHDYPPLSPIEPHDKNGCSFHFLEDPKVARPTEK